MTSQVFLIFYSSVSLRKKTRNSSSKRSARLLSNSPMTMTSSFLRTKPQKSLLKSRNKNKSKMIKKTLKKTPKNTRKKMRSLKSILTL